MITNIDLSIMLFVQEHLRSDIGNIILKFITHLGDAGWFWIAIGVALLFFKKTRSIGASVLLSLVINAFFTNITLKDLIARPRPFNVCDAIVPLVKKPSSFSFPSGHTSASLTAAFVLYKMTPKKVGIPAVILATLIGLSRIYVGVHYPTDVLGGVAVAIVSSIWGCYLVNYWKMKYGENKWQRQKNKN